MNSLIRLFARGLAAQYAKGSVAGGVVGACLGCGTGVLLAILLSNWDVVESPIGAGFLLAITGAFLLSLLGSLAGPKPAANNVAQHGSGVGQLPIRFYRLNQNLVPLPFIVLLTAFGIYVINHPNPRGDPADKWIGPAALALAAIVLVIQGCMVLCVCIDTDAIRLFRLFRSTTVKCSDIEQAGFTSPVDPFDVSTDDEAARTYVICMRNGRRIEFNVPPHKVQSLVNLMGKRT